MTSEPGSTRISKWDLTAESLQALLDGLAPHPEVAAQKFEVLRLKLFHFFQAKGCLTSEDLVDKTIDRTACKVLEGGVASQCDDINRYAYGVARFIWQEHLTEARTTKNLDQSVTETFPIVTVPTAIAGFNLHHEERFQCLEKCLATLPPDEQELVLGYHDSGKNKENRKHLADRLSISLGTLATRACRIREKLEHCIDLCLQHSSKNT
ncbi:MAG: sigma-70 family RNA polymerase sigma factor [Acidobacteria bacterium]|nr:sigma-70 family RNA polymerase sigma factor [Acidobacteriota bacterium]